MSVHLSVCASMNNLDIATFCVKQEIDKMTKGGSTTKVIVFINKLKDITARHNLKFY